MLAKDIASIINPLVSEKVLGWERKVLPNNPDGYHYYANFWVDDDGNQEKPTEFWSPATDIKDAWELLELLRNDGVLVSLETVIDKYRSSVDGDFACYSASAPLAICIAALKSAGIDLPETYHNPK